MLFLVVTVVTVATRADFPRPHRLFGVTTSVTTSVTTEPITKHNETEMQKEATL